MKLLVLHGPATNSSRQKLLEIKKSFDSDNIVVFEKDSSNKGILENLQTIPMFDGERLVIVENSADDLFPKLLTIHNKQSLRPDGLELLTVILWFDHEVDITDKNTQVFFFPEAREVSVFPLLRLLGSRSPEAFSQLDKLKKANYDNQYFITMILYLLRNLISTPKKATHFVRQNNERMTKNFSKDELVTLYKNILEIDFKIKKGLMESLQAEFSMVNSFLLK